MTVVSQTEESMIREVQFIPVTKNIPPQKNKKYDTTCHQHGGYWHHTSVFCDLLLELEVDDEMKQLKD